MSRVLESLRTVRSSEEAAAREALASELRIEASTTATSTAARRALDAAAARLSEAMSTAATTAAERSDRDAYAARLRREHAAARAVHDAATLASVEQARRVEAAREALALAHAEKRVTEVRIDRAAEGRRLEADRRDDD